MTTIHNGTTLGVYLSSSTYTNPVAVEAGVVISNVSGGPGVFGSAASGFWTIQNAGSIDAYYGVFLFGGGSVTNTTAASIIGVGHGIAMSNGAGTVVNDGNMSSQTISYGVRLTDGGAVTNTAGASIIGGIVGVHIQTVLEPSSTTVRSAGFTRYSVTGCVSQRGSGHQWCRWFDHRRQLWHCPLQCLQRPSERGWFRNCDQ